MIQPIGYFKIHRELFSKPIWLKATVEQQVVMLLLIAMASFKPNQWEWQGKMFDLQEGQFITSAESIIENSGNRVTRQNIRSTLSRLKKLEFLTYETTKTGTLVTITNWASYQCGNQQPTKEPTNGQPTGNQQATKAPTTIEEGIIKKGNKEISINTFFESIWEFYPVKKGKASVSDKQKTILYKIGYDEIHRCFERYEKDKEEWKAFQQGSTFFNSGYFDYLDKNYIEQKPNETSFKRIEGGLQG